MKKKIFSLLMIIIYFSTLFLILNESLVSNFTIYFEIIFNSKLFIFISLALLIIFKLKFNENIKLLSLLNLSLLLAAASISTYFIFFEFFTEKGVVLDSYQILYYRFIYLALYAALVAIINNYNFFLKYKLLVFWALPLLIIPIHAFLHNEYSQLFTFLIKEDSVYEYAQLTFLLGSFIFSLLLAKKNHKKSRKLLAVLYLLAASIFFLLAGEEISWGQRILNLQTPEQLLEKNLQEELNIHNIDRFFGFVYRGYMLIGFYGAFAWLFALTIKSRVSKKFKLYLKSLIPDWFFSSYFLIIALHYLDRIYLKPATGFDAWEELFEGFLLFAIAGFLIYSRQRDL